MKKFKLTSNTKVVLGRTLYQIESLIDFASVRVGEKGGWIESEKNLSQDGNSWVCGNAKVYGDAKVYDNAWVCDNAKVYGDAWVCGNATVRDNAKVYGDAWVCGNATVRGNAKVCGNAKVYGDAEVYGNAWVRGNATVYGDAEVHGDAWVCDNADLLWISRIGSRLGTTTVFKDAKKGLSVSCGCFLGTLEEFEKKIAKTHGDNKFAREYQALIALIKIHFEI